MYETVDILALSGKTMALPTLTYSRCNELAFAIQFTILLHDCLILFTEKSQKYLAHAHAMTSFPRVTANAIIL